MSDLTQQQRDSYREQGFLGPLTLMSVAEMEALRPELAAVLDSPGRAPAPAAEQVEGRLANLVVAAAARARCRTSRAATSTPRPCTA
ncbi:hypothetical protein ACFQ1I_33440 [Kitasatospora arboriphila]